MMNSYRQGKDKYCSIKALNALIIKYKAPVKVSKEIFLGDRKDFPLVILSLDKQSFQLFVDDEYNDFNYNNHILNFCIVLRGLENYKFSGDYLVWCAERYIDASDTKIRTYYMGLDKIYNKIKAILGEINSFIPDNDFEFDMGEVKTLREENR